MKKLFPPTDQTAALDPDAVHENARRQFWLSAALLFALALAALGQVRPAGEAQATTGFVHVRVVPPTFAPPVMRTPLPSSARVRIG
ncbi:MAG: hypothetical protein ACLPSW_04580 [Roseiarcus sp.]